MDRTLSSICGGVISSSLGALLLCRLATWSLQLNIVPNLIFTSVLAEWVKCMMRARRNSKTSKVLLPLSEMLKVESSLRDFLQYTTLYWNINISCLTSGKVVRWENVFENIFLYFALPASFSPLFILEAYFFYVLFSFNIVGVASPHCLLRTVQHLILLSTFPSCSLVQYSIKEEEKKKQASTNEHGKSEGLFHSQQP